MTKKKFIKAVPLVLMYGGTFIIIGCCLGIGFTPISGDRLIKIFLCTGAISFIIFFIGAFFMEILHENIA